MSRMEKLSQLWPVCNLHMPLFLHANEHSHTLSIALDCLLAVPLYANLFSQPIRF